MFALIELIKEKKQKNIEIANTKYNKRLRNFIILSLDFLVS